MDKHNGNRWNHQKTIRLNDMLHYIKCMHEVYAVHLLIHSCRASKAHQRTRWKTEPESSTQLSNPNTDICCCCCCSWLQLWWRPSRWRMAWEGSINSDVRVFVCVCVFVMEGERHSRGLILRTLVWLKPLCILYVHFDTHLPHWADLVTVGVQMFYFACV